MCINYSRLITHVGILVVVLVLRSDVNSMSCKGSRICNIVCKCSRDSLLDKTNFN